MSVYTLIVKIPQAGNKEVSYSVTLNKLHESYPEDYFRLEKNRLDLSQAIQQSARQVSPASLDSIISKWISEIKCGLHYTTVTLDLPSEFSSAPEQVPTSPVNNFTTVAKNTEITAKSKQPVRNSTTQPAAQPATQPITKPITQPVAQTITKPANQPAAQPSSPATPPQNSLTQPVTRPANPSPSSKNSTQEASTSPSDIRSDTNQADF